jgi:hypothetical protein
MDGVVLETGHDDISHRDEEHLEGGERRKVNGRGKVGR